MPDHRPDHGSDRAVAEGGCELRLALDDVLDLVVRAAGDQFQIVDTRSQDDMVTSPLRGFAS
ncbi:hypothetical protein [Streptomyces sp. NPDC088847]|uniref:hypothetical protein n=1 Tax=Streptomyces sp. NPDC088847 TaxID=3365909 RepID=UPI00382767FD